MNVLEPDEEVLLVEFTVERAIANGAAFRPGKVQWANAS
jgi:hypothetical protein